MFQVICMTRSFISRLQGLRFGVCTQATAISCLRHVGVLAQHARLGFILRRSTRGTLQSTRQLHIRAPFPRARHRTATRSLLRIEGCKNYSSAREHNHVAMEHPDQESVDPNEAGRPRPAAAKRRMSAIDGTPTRLQPKRKAKDRRRVSFAPSLTSVQFFNKVRGGSQIFEPPPPPPPDATALTSNCPLASEMTSNPPPQDEDNSGELAPGRSRFGVPDIPQGPWEDQEPSATVTAEVPPPSPMDVSMELTEPWQRETQPADEVTASVPSLGDLLSSEPDATESITAAVPGLSSLVDESREEVALTQAPEAGVVPDGADMDVTLLDGELAGCRQARGIFAGLDFLVGAPACLHHHLVHPACNCRDLGMRPLLLTGSHCPLPRPGRRFRGPGPGRGERAALSRPERGWERAGPRPGLQVGLQPWVRGHHGSQPGAAWAHDHG